MKYLLLLLCIFTSSQAISACCHEEEPCIPSAITINSYMDDYAEQAKEDICSNCKCCSLMAFTSSFEIQEDMNNTEIISLYSESTLFISSKPKINPPDNF